MQRPPMLHLTVATLIWLSCPALASPHTPTKLNACGLITKKEVQDVAGVQMTDGNLADLFALSGSSIMAGTTQCHFAALDGQQGNRSVVIQLQGKKNPSEAAQALNEFIASLQSPNNPISLLDSCDPVQGIGEKAYWLIGLPAPTGELYVLSRRYYFSIKITAGTAKENLQQAKELAARALQRLP